MLLELIFVEMFAIEFIVALMKSDTVIVDDAGDINELMQMLRAFGFIELIFVGSKLFAHPGTFAV